jgi:hypothetical protein
VAGQQINVYRQYAAVPAGEFKVAAARETVPTPVSAIFSWGSPFDI